MRDNVILRLLDTGAQGCHVPWIGNATDAEQAVRGVTVPDAESARAWIERGATYETTPRTRPRLRHGASTY